MKPTDECYEDALKYRIKSYEYINDETGIKEVLSMNKPVIIAMRVFQDFMYADKENFIIKMPDDDNLSLGGHAVAVVGYTKDNHFIIKNSFGTDWGNDGYALLPLEYMKKYVFDRWHFSLFEDPEKEKPEVSDTLVEPHELQFFTRVNIINNFL